MARYFSTAAARVAKLCECKLAPRRVCVTCCSLTPLGIRQVPGFLCRPTFINHDHTMKTLFAVALSTTEKNAGIRVPPPWTSIPSPCWTPPRLEANIKDNVRPTDLAACA
eukprot:419925-Pyramimonas_sp.AAC.1